MKFKIHRAADEIGGNCIEVQSGGKSILLDLGLPLVAGKPDARFMPHVDGLTSGDNADLLGIIVSHPHQDHYGLLSCAHPSIPVYIGDSARRLLGAAEFFTRIARIAQPITSYRSGQPFSVGPFVITPLAVDHSAYDAHALLIEADGKRLFYSGDFRMHGRKAEVMESLLKHPPANIDLLLMEGTVLGREDEEANSTEADVERDIAASLRKRSGLALAYFSAQNIDRLITFHRAATQAGRTFVVDVYTAGILDSLNGEGLPSPHADGIRVFLPKRQKLQIVRGKRFDLVEPYKRKRVYASELAGNPGRWLAMFRSSMKEDFEAIKVLAGATVLYSLWPGYLDRDEDDLREWAKRHGARFEIHHTSGHAYAGDLVRFVRALAPKALVPIHTVRPDRYPAMFPNVRIVPNQRWETV